MLPGRLTLIAMRRPMGTVTGAGLCDGCTGYSGHRLPSARRLLATHRLPFTWTGGVALSLTDDFTESGPME